MSNETYLVEINGKAVGRADSLDEAKSLALREKKDGQTASVHLPRAPAPTIIWTYHENLEDWSEDRQGSPIQN